MTKKILILLVFVLTVSPALTTFASSNEASSKKEALAHSTYYLPFEDKIVLDVGGAKAKNKKLTKFDIQQVELFLESLSSEDIEQILIDNGYDLNEVKVDDTELAYANIVWYVPVIIIAILISGALIFSAMYFNYKEKQNLVNRCYNVGGRPIIDSRDKTGINGSPDSGEASRIGGYKFECRK
jgi:hypothetical protein